jgi:hypothetical protein
MKRKPITQRLFNIPLGDIVLTINANRDNLRPHDLMFIRRAVDMIQETVELNEYDDARSNSADLDTMELSK